MSDSKPIQILELFPGLNIKVYSDGRIETLDHIEIRKNGRRDGRKGRLLKPKIDRYGYERIAVSHKGVRKDYLVHRLVAAAFIPNPTNKPTVNHIDGNKRNNDVSNLEWATHSEQKRHAISHGLCTKNIEALNNHNLSVSKPVIFHNKEYPSIRSAVRKTGAHQRVIKREGDFDGQR